MVARAVRWCSALAAIGVAAALVAVAFAREPAGGSGIRGRVVACGIVHERTSCSRDVRGAKVRVRRADDGRPIATVRADANGRFRVAVRPGSYVLEVVATPRTARRDSPARIPVTVRKQGWTTVALPTARLSPPARA